jgi:hypothetical protein
MKDYFILLLFLAVACTDASKAENLHEMRSKGANMSADILMHIGQFLTPGDLIGKMAGTCKRWSKVNWKLVYENVTPTNNPIAVFKKIDEEKFYLEDPMDLLNPANNGWTLHANICPTIRIDFSTATWGDVFQYSVSMRSYLGENRFNRLFSENATEFLKVLAITAAKNCPLGFKAWGILRPLYFAVSRNDLDVAKVLLQRGAGNETNALERAISDRNMKMVTIFLENDADGHAPYGLRIHKWCARYLSQFELLHRSLFFKLINFRKK